MANAPDAVTEPIVLAEDVHKRFHSLEVLKGINLSVDGGEVVVIMALPGAASPPSSAA